METLTARKWRSRVDGSFLFQSLFACNVVKTKINSRLEFRDRKKQLLDVSFHRLLCNASNWPHFDHTCIVRYPNKTKKLQDKLQVTQNKSIKFCFGTYREHKRYGINIKLTLWKTKIAANKSNVLIIGNLYII